MKLLQCKVENFASYDHLEFDFQDKGLSLIFGATGSGKSTLLDVAVWILYGETAKGGNADEIRPLDGRTEPTTGTMHVELQDGAISVNRIRGKSSENDLYWTESTGVVRRGKDLTETQKLLNERLGMNSTTFFTSGYFCEFSPVSSFFTSTLQHRRQVFENIANLELPVKLANKIVKERQPYKIALEEMKDALSNNQGQLYSLKSGIPKLNTSIDKWNTNQNEILKDLTIKRDTFDNSKQKEIEEVKNLKVAWISDKLDNKTKLINKIFQLKESIKSDSYFDSSPVCGSCGGINAVLIKEQRDNDRLKMMLKSAEASLDDLKSLINPHDEALIRIKSSTNQFDRIIETEKDKINPFLSQKDTTICDIAEVEKNVDTLKSEVADIAERLSQLEHLQDIALELRGELLKNVVREVESSTNKYLDSHFDSEFKVEFNIEGSDKLDIKIHKNGHECVFRQLSKGQRQLLKLSFGVSIMKAASNRSGIHVDNLFFDEALDGMDSDLKVKAFNLFSELESQHGTVLVVEHSPEFQELFSEKYNVVMTGDVSTINEM